jgi:hypothetical protein
MSVEKSLGIGECGITVAIDVFSCEAWDYNDEQEKIPAGW